MKNRTTVPRWSALTPTRFLRSRILKRVEVNALHLIAIAFAAAITSAADASYPIDLATALKLAGAQNLDVAIARERVSEAEATQEQARQRFFPFLTPGLQWRRHDGRTQDVIGNMLDTRKQTLGLGVTVGAQVDLGDAYYQSLASKQLTRAASEALNTRRQDAIFQAAAGYFELARAAAAVGAARDALRIADAYTAEVKAGVAAGIASAGDAARAEVQSAKNRTLVATAEEQRAVAAARLATTLRLAPGTELQPRDAELAPLTLFPADTTPGALVTQALAKRPELSQAGALTEAAETQLKAAKVGPLVPTVGATAQLGALRGGRGGALGSFADSEDYAIGVSWRVGPGGLGDTARHRAAEARTRSVKLERDRVSDQVTREVIEAHARVRGVAARLAAASDALRAAEAAWKFSRDRRDFGVAAVLEAVQAEQDYTRARLDYLQAVAEHNAAHYALQRAVGGATS